MLHSVKTLVREADESNVSFTKAAVCITFATVEVRIARQLRKVFGIGAAGNLRSKGCFHMPQIVPVYSIEEGMALDFRYAVSSKPCALIT